MAIWPTAVAATLDLLQAVNNTKVLLTTDAGVGDTTLLVDDSSHLPSSGYLTFDDNDANPETIQYTGKTGTSLTGVSRAADGTNAATHAGGVAHIEQRWNAAYHNKLVTEIIAIENDLGQRFGADSGAHQILSPDGSASAPQFSFAFDTNTGIWRATTDTLAFATGGVTRMSISSTNITASLPLNMSANKITGVYDGTVGAPSIASSSYANTGIAFNILTNCVSLVTAGAEALRVNGGQQTLGAKGSVANPGWSSLNDASTGWDCFTVHNFAVVASSVQVANFATVGRADAQNDIPLTLYGAGATISASNHMYSNNSVTSVASQVAQIDRDGALILINGHDAGFSNGFVDLLLSNYSSPGATVVSSRTMFGSPAARTYSAGATGALKLAMGSGTYLCASWSLQLDER